MNREDFSVATFNLFNLQEPGKPMNEGQTPWTPEQFELKIQWTVWQLTTLNPDIVGLQELWSRRRWTPSWTTTTAPRRTQATQG